MNHSKVLAYVGNAHTCVHNDLCSAQMFTSFAVGDHFDSYVIGSDPPSRFQPGHHYHFQPQLSVAGLHVLVEVPEGVSALHFANWFRSRTTLQWNSRLYGNQTGVAGGNGRLWRGHWQHDRTCSGWINDSWCRQISKNVKRCIKRSHLSALNFSSFAVTGLGKKARRSMLEGLKSHTEKNQLATCNIPAYLITTVPRAASGMQYTVVLFSVQRQARLTNTRKHMHAQIIFCFWSI